MQERVFAKSVTNGWGSACRHGWAGLFFFSTHPVLFIPRLHCTRCPQWLGILFIAWAYPKPGPFDCLGSRDTSTQSSSSFSTWKPEPPTQYFYPIFLSNISFKRKSISGSSVCLSSMYLSMHLSVYLASSSSSSSSVYLSSMHLSSMYLSIYLSTYLSSMQLSPPPFPSPFCHFLDLYLLTPFFLFFLLCNPRSSRTHYIDQAILNLTATLSLRPECWDYEMCTTMPSSLCFFRMCPVLLSWGRNI